MTSAAPSRSPAPSDEASVSKPIETLAGWRAANARRVFVRELQLEGSIGVHAHERKGTQPVVVSLDLQVDDGANAKRLVFTPPPQPSEAVTRTVVCYESLTNMVAGLLSDGHIDYVETLAERIAARCLEDDRVLEVTVRIEKPEAIAQAASAGVEIVRRR